MSHFRALLRVAAFLLAALGTVGVVQAQSFANSDITIPETVWGFDGKVVRETFSPLSILVQNSGAKPLSGTLRLSRRLPLGPETEPPIEVDFDVPPFEERWVQVAPYMVDEFLPWQISWGPGEKQKMELPQARIGGAAVVLLTNPNERPRPSGALKRFRSNLFPASITMTDGLDTVFLDSIPDFQGARLQAFLEWLHRGGKVVLLHNDEDAYPRFPSALAALNDTGDSFAAGSGRVRRLPTRARDVDERQLRLAKAGDRPGQIAPEAKVVFTDPYHTHNGRIFWNRDRKVLEKLEGVSQFHRRWWLIYPLSLLYLATVFPGTFIIARQATAVRWFYVAYISAAVLFSLAFKTLGGVGGGDANRIRSATIARQTSPGVYDVSQWNCLAAVTGGWYSLSHDGGGRMYAPCEEFESAQGKVTVGTQARFEVDIPVASTRAIVARFRATAPPFAVEMRSTECVDQKLSACSLAFTGLPVQPLEAYVCHRESILRMTPAAADAWTTDRRRSSTTSVFVSNLDQLASYTFNMRGKTDKPSQLSEDFYRSLERVLVGNAFQLREYVDPSSATMPPGFLRVMALVPDAKTFAGQAEGFADVQGCVLYVMDLPVSDK